MPLVTRLQQPPPHDPLFEYGIHTEDSDVRAHVSVVNKTLYVFRTENGLRAIERHNPPLGTATQPGVDGVTAEGWLVKAEWIEDLRSLRFTSWSGWPKADMEKKMSTSEKGAMAVKCVVECMRRGRFPFWIEASEEDRKDIQLKGTDIVVFCNKRVQVKCDWRSGDKPLGTGNFFLQKAERNPLHRY